MSALGKRVGFTFRKRRPVYPEHRTSLDRPGWSVRRQEATSHVLSEWQRPQTEAASGWSSWLLF